MITTLQRFSEDEGGTTSMVIKLVVCIVIAAAILIITLQLLHINHETAVKSTKTLADGTKKALTESMKTTAG